jgi:hypothetical protein
VGLVENLRYAHYYHFQATLEGWMEIMRDAVDATGVGFSWLLSVKLLINVFVKFCRNCSSYKSIKATAKTKYPKKICGV